MAVDNIKINVASVPDYQLGQHRPSPRTYFLEEHNSWSRIDFRIIHLVTASPPELNKIRMHTKFGE